MIAKEHETIDITVNESDMYILLTKLVKQYNPRIII